MSTGFASDYNRTLLAYSPGPALASRLFVPSVEQCGQPQLLSKTFARQLDCRVGPDAAHGIAWSQQAASG